jgi:hypothetical protein
MFWELLATVFAGLGAAGIALTLRFITARRLPRWVIPMSAGGAMLAFQIYSEYSWFSHQKTLLPDDVVVVKEIEETTAWRPWTFFAPQTVRFIAVRVSEGAVNKTNPDLVLAELYFFERRHLAKKVPQVFHCVEHARADLSEELIIPAPGTKLDDQWLTLPADDPVLLTVCQKALSLRT